MRPYDQRPSTLRGLASGIPIPPGYKMNVNGEIVPTDQPGATGLNTPFHGYTTEDTGDPYGGYAGGGGGYGAPPPRQLASSPEWLAYLNALGLEENQFRADIDRQRGVLQSAADLQVQSLIPGYQAQRGNIASSESARGMTNSGEYLKRVAESQAAQGRQTAGIQSALAQSLSGLESSLAGKLMDLGARRAQEELNLRTQGYV